MICPRAFGCPDRKGWLAYRAAATVQSSSISREEPHARAIPRCAFALAALILLAGPAPAQDQRNDWSGQWTKVPDGGPPRYDPSKPIRGQEAPLKPEYRVRHEASMRAQDGGPVGPP